MVNDFNLNNLKTTLLSFEAKRWIGILEEGENSGQLIQIFQRSVDGQTNKESWCMAFAQYCIKMTERAFVELFPDEPAGVSVIFRSEHCLTTWNRSPELQTSTPVKGSLCVWQKFNGREATSSGHTGIVTDLHADGTISVVEGNTSSSNKAIEREGDGVYLKRYTVGKMDRGALALKGFLRVWM